MESISKQDLLFELNEQVHIQLNAVKNCINSEQVDLNKMLVETSKLQALERLVTYFSNKKYERKTK